jgi:hypothetical protein
MSNILCTNLYATKWIWMKINTENLCTLKVGGKAEIQLMWVQIGFYFLITD